MQNESKEGESQTTSFRLPNHLREAMKQVKQDTGKIMSLNVEECFYQCYPKDGRNSDTKRLDWLADVENKIGNVQLPRQAVINNLASLRDAIDEAMEYDQ